jgi:hypothetical protein
MCVNTKMRPVETTPGIRRGGMKESSAGVGAGGGNSSMTYLKHCKNLCKCYNVSPPSTIIKKRKHSLI